MQPFAAEDPDACKQDEANGRNQFKEQKGGDEDTSLEQIKIEASSELSTLPVYQIGDEVTVLPRTWPGRLFRRLSVCLFLLILISALPT